MRIIDRRYFVKFFSQITTTDDLGQRVRSWSSAPIASTSCMIKEQRSIEDGYKREFSENNITIEFKPSIYSLKPEMLAVIDDVNYIVKVVYPVTRTKMRVQLLKQK